MKEEKKVYIKQMELGPMQNFVYLIGDPLTKEVAIVDPGWEASTILDIAEHEGFSIKMILLTHSHYDHVDAMGELIKATNAKVMVHEKEAPYIKVAPENIIKTKEGDVVKVGEYDVQILHTPGHSPGSQCFLVDGNLISGDTLFIDYCGRSDLPGSSTEELYYSLHKRLGQLPAETRVFPGHHYSKQKISTIGEEKKKNPYMIDQSLKDFLRAHGKML